MRPKVVWPAATTTVVGVVGFPARHSLSPRLHNAAFAAMGLDWCYLAFEVPAGLIGAGRRRRGRARFPRPFCDHAS